MYPTFTCLCYLTSYRKLYVAVSVSVCVLVSALVLFFLYPRCVTLSPVAVKSVFVTFPSNTVLMNITVSRVLIQLTMNIYIVMSKQQLHCNRIVIMQ